MRTSRSSWPAGYSERPAPPALRHLVACMWAQVIPEDGAAPVLVLPDGCTDLVWERGRGAFIAGPDTGPAPTVLPPGTRVIGIRFRPGAGGRLLGLPLCELRDQRVEFAAIKRGLARRLPGTLEPVAAEARVLAVAADLSLGGEADVAVMHAARLLGDPQTRTDHVASALSLSSRQLRRRWQAEIGYSPKTFQRVLRFRRFVSRLDAAGSLGALDLATVAFETGYADQAHLTRECARFAGVSPTALARLRRTGDRLLHVLGADRLSRMPRARVDFLLSSLESRLNL
jgi:AraC-like DNA-binding protein